MATGIVALLDDIALLADDTATATRHVATATAPILGDDVAVNAGAATGFSAKRELIVIWAITKGALRNKLIILPFAFILSFYIPIVITLTLIAGGIFLLYEGGEKVEEYLHIKLGYSEHHKENLKASTPENVIDVERKKIKSAILTDFILSIEIVVISMNAVQNKELVVQIASVTIISFAAVFFVYGLVALIVRMDDLGLAIQKKGYTKIGEVFIISMPKVIKGLSILGTIAMFLVGGGILTHNIPIIHEYSHITNINIINDAIVGLVGSAIVVSFVEIYLKIFNFLTKHKG
ncbi:DUF808 family protein [Pseudofrancisella aestuarii]|uniref:DUF808 family protein n=1 Tax=Pseudofrancisella aestuarii TaxID=2670347 RepID=A0ABV9TAG3_9GAMM|nr:DUF808 family protein [Pseudofrancisella aestuarii]